MMRYIVLVVLGCAYAADAQELPICDAERFEALVLNGSPADMVISRCKEYVLGDKVNQDETLRWLATLGRVELLEALLDSGYSIEMRTGKDLVFYSLASEQDPVEMVSFLISRGIDIDAANINSHIVYHAIELGHWKSLRLILENLRDKQALYEPLNLFAAITSQNLDLASEILDHGGDPNIQRDGETPLLLRLYMKLIRRCCNC
jgi:hypothetical protein